MEECGQDNKADESVASTADQVGSLYSFFLPVIVQPFSLDNPMTIKVGIIAETIGEE